MFTYNRGKRVWMIFKNYFFGCLLLVGLLTASPLDYINQIRAKSGLSYLRYSKVLSKAARKHALYIFKNRTLGHFESSTKPYYFARTPWNRIVRAGYKTAVVVENISFYEPSFKASINKLMATVYHRLAFLSLRVDTLGFGRLGNIYVYDMSNSKIAMLCGKNYKNSGAVIENVCHKKRATVPQGLFYDAIDKVKKKSKSIVVYPYKNQINVPLEGAQEQPLFFRKGFGYPVTITFNTQYYQNVSLKSFKLYTNNRVIGSKIITAFNDRNKKIESNTFVLVPLKTLSSKAKYRVKITVALGEKDKTFEWDFTTR